MRIYLYKVTIATTLSVMGLGIYAINVEASTLFIGRYGRFAQDINSVGFIPPSESLSKFIDQDNQLITVNQKQLKTDKLIKTIDTLPVSKPLKEQIQKEYVSFEKKGNPEKNNINQNIDKRYHNLIETQSEKINLIANHKLTKDLLSKEASEQTTTNSTKQTLPKIEDSLNQNTVAITNILPKFANVGIFVIVLSGGCIMLVPIINAFGSSENQGLFRFFGFLKRAKISDNAINLHHSTFLELNKIARQAKRIDDDKFTKQEFILYIQLRNKVKQGIAEYQNIHRSIKYLEVGIAAQGSYLKIEQTELRYRGRKQQDFYEFVIENITEDINKHNFRNLVKRKLAETMPLVNSEAGRDALKSYMLEIEKIAKYDFGLKLLSLFKKYQLADFTILKKVSDLVERVNAQDLLDQKQLTILILENYETLEKLAPIIEINQENINTTTFAKIIKYMGLVKRYEKAYQEFQDLIKVLQKWEKPYKSLQMIRDQYPQHEYQLPKEFSLKIPGLNVYQKYEKYLTNLND